MKMNTEKTKQAGRARLGQFMGHSVVAVIRAMGAAGFSYLEAKTALDKAKFSPAENTIRIQLRAGAKKLAKPADIDPKDLEALRPKLTGSEADTGNARAEKKTPRKSTRSLKAKAKK